MNLHRAGLMAEQPLYGSTSVDPVVPVEVSCHVCASPIESGAVISRGKAHCGFECAAVTMSREPQAIRFSPAAPGPGSAP